MKISRRWFLGGAASLALLAVPTPKYPTIRISPASDFDTSNVRYDARERYVYGWTDHRAIWAAEL